MAIALRDILFLIVLIKGVLVLLSSRGEGKRRRNVGHIVGLTFIVISVVYIVYPWIHSPVTKAQVYYKIIQSVIIAISYNLFLIAFITGTLVLIKTRRKRYGSRLTGYIFGCAIIVLSASYTFLDVRTYLRVETKMPDHQPLRMYGGAQPWLPKEIPRFR